MATTQTVHAQLIRYATNGDQIIVNLKSAGSDISIDRSSNTKLPTTVTSAQTLANSLGALAFKDSLAKGDVGLGNVDNTADSAKNVKYATSAGSAGSATKSTQDSAGQQINTTYIKGISISGRTVTITKGDGTTSTQTTQDSTYSHPNSGVTAGTYRSVTVNAQGHVTGGSNPTTLAGYGITDAATKSHTHTASQITDKIPASKIDGVLSLSNIPAAAQERVYVAADDTARLALTTANVQNGDVVKVTSTGKMYFVVDETKLNSESGYMVFAAGTAASVAWGNVTDKPSTFTPSSHTHNYAGSGSAGGSANSAVKLDSSAGSATQPVYFSGGKPVATTYTLGKSVPSDAVFTDHTYSAFKGATSSAAGGAGLVPAPATGNVGQFLRGDGTWATPTDTKYTHPNSGVTAGTYRSVTVNAQGHVTAGTNPTTLSGYGITDAAAKSHTHNYAGSSSAGGSANAAVKLATARTINGVSFDGSVNISVTANPTSNELVAKDLNEIKTPGFYFSGGSNTCTNKPTNVDAFGLIVFKAAAGYIVQICMEGNTSLSKTWYRQWNSSAWSAWGYYYSTGFKPSKSDVGLGNVDNTADSAKSVKYATSAGSANAVAWGNVSGKPTTLSGYGITDAAAKSHTHNYAGSGSAGGSANSAVKLDSSAGSATQPVYFSGGKPVATTYTLGKSVPSDAVFTDHTYSVFKGATSSAAGGAGLVPAPATGNVGQFLRGDGTWATPTNTDTKVTQTVVASASYTNWRTVLWGASNSATEGFTPATTTDGVFANENLTYQPSSGTLRAKVFKGSLSGNASTATSATSASKLATARTVSGGTDITMSYSYDGSANSSASIGYYSANISVGNTNNYPFHRFAKVDKITGSYVDLSSIFLITQDYGGGGFGIVRVTLRTNNSSSVSTVEVKWLARVGLAADSVQVGLYNVYGSTYADIFFKTSGGYAGTVIRTLSNGARGSIKRTWTLISSSEVNDTTTSDAKTSKESYATIAAAGTALHNQAYTRTDTGMDSATVSYANSAGSATTATSASNLKDSNNSNAITAAYSKSGMNYADYTWVAAWNGYELRAINKNQFAQASHSHSAATSSANGYMSSTDKAKLDFGDIVYVSKTAPTKACIWVKLD